MCFAVSEIAICRSSSEIVGMSVKVQPSRFLGFIELRVFGGFFMDKCVAPSSDRLSRM